MMMMVSFLVWGQEERVKQLNISASLLDRAWVYMPIRVCLSISKFLEQFFLFSTPPKEVDIHMRMQLIHTDDFEREALCEMNEKISSGLAVLEKKKRNEERRDKNLYNFNVYSSLGRYI